MTYTISDLEQLSGIQSHTIRIWEQRYNALTPMRSEGNTRFYDDKQLVKLLNIVSLNQSGLKISKICKLSDDEVKTLLVKEYHQTSDDQQTEYYITQLIKFGIAFDEKSFCDLLNEALSAFGLSETYKKIMYPLLVRLGLMWLKDDICPAHEHFLTNIIRQKIFSSINDIQIETAKSKTWLLFLPEDEDHDIGLLYANFFLRSAKQKVIFLGSKVPLNSVERVLALNNIDHVLLFMVKSRQIDTAQQYINQLSAICHSTQIHLAGNGNVIEKLTKSDHINWIKSLNDFENSIPTQTTK
ncbi:MerR family transcriptional regulator [Pedobacter fastidiosus]|uniref:MerR family transcriptional regulator n=1 Tax=Pedobacter fastidiosus TaxID=2765361 RepID=A0ABR7KNT9_9SPHI|nr:MerR family transcriptional regulator [Pedobacter fastidiosus]MBC6109403.1 MerR family transcriptional regulator [Pedobacter fastidiosus]